METADPFATVEVEALRVAMSGPSPCPVAPTEISQWTCEWCDNVGMDQVDGYVCCQRCGMTKDSVFDYAAEWRAIGGKGDSGRCGMPTNPLLPNSSITTMLVGTGNFFVKKLHLWGSMNHREAAKYKLFTYIQSRATLFGMSPAIVNHTQQYIGQVCDRMVEDDTVFRGDNRRGIVAACLHYAFKTLNCPRGVQEVARILDVDQSCVTTGINLFSRLFADKDLIKKDKRTDPMEIVPRFCSQLGVPFEVEELVKATCAVIAKNGALDTNIVEAQAAACIWNSIKAAGIEKMITKKRVSATCGVSEVTIAKCCRRMLAAAGKTTAVK